MGVITAVLLLAAMVMTVAVVGDDTNHVYEPCADTKIQKDDGFSFGIAFSTKQSFFDGNNVQLSPCDSRLSLSSSSSAQFALFRPKVDEISLLTINTTLYPSATSGGFMVAFAGRKYAARSIPAFVGNTSYIVTSFTLVLEFKKGTLQNLYWKRDACASCSGKSSFVCLNNQDCAIRMPNCISQGAQLIAALAYSLLSPAQTKMMLSSTRGTRCPNSANTLSMAFIPT